MFPRNVFDLQQEQEFSVLGAFSTYETPLLELKTYLDLGMHQLSLIHLQNV